MIGIHPVRKFAKNQIFTKKHHHKSMRTFATGKTTIPPFTSANSVLDDSQAGFHPEWIPVT
jgi:hypothetical protein